MTYQASPQHSSPDSQTESLDQQLLETITVQDRQYQKYSIDHRISFVPVDEEEAERLEIQHRVFQRVFDDRLIFPPVSRPRRVLDCGYGAGSWAIEAAERYPYCEVTGVDISPHMNPDDMPDNLWLQVDDLNRSFTFDSNWFDLVHSRLLATGLNRSRWQSYFQDIKRVLKPGGWVQVVEIYFNVQSDNGSITEEHGLRQWSARFMRSLEDTKDLRVGTRLKALMMGAGLVDIDVRMIPLPLSAWSGDPRMREIGMVNRENVKRLFSALAHYPLTQSQRMPQEEFQTLVTKAAHEADNPRIKAYFPVYVCIGRKP
ncbi:class I SAM-dependent methyltransferase [Aspergillus ruber CBS 135680]|uniref:S-adenosyl-L-methionine-dependent methyltransferase n=1 Tax=Aspergillus ruber (strain CBS 135680) TaxID=1388766 RepID=A0A017SL12_ASPRC|nr:S-adenosyl-L-methionine-dependent methyltransferase [Aspergillus ruber CBS 135680]EYE97607.1 S-adenosyl-L-methionine-dependent methyltransferase [Aspergillus ruber CBS 135680]